MRRISFFPSKLLVLGSVCALLVGVSWSADDSNQSDIAKRIDASAKVLDEIMAVKDKAIPDKVMRDSKCIAVIPSMIEIAVGFGGNHGKGVATCRTENGWSAPAPITIAGGSWGLQLGGQAVDLVMVIMNQQGMDHLLASKFKLGADASAAAGPVGRDAGADTDIRMKAEVLTYSRARGLFAGIELNGASLTQDKDETRLLYGKPVSFPDILSGKVEATASSRSFLAVVRRYSEAEPRIKPESAPRFGRISGEVSRLATTRGLEKGGDLYTILLVVLILLLLGAIAACPTAVRGNTTPAADSGLIVMGRDCSAACRSLVTVKRRESLSKLSL